MRLKSIRRPEYLWRPAQLARRLRLLVHEPDGRAEVCLPWGDPITVDSAQSVGLAILRLGIFDLPVAEALWRLTEPGDEAVDVGAHIGIMTSLLARRCGPGATVHAFEPQPVTAALLRENVSHWPKGATIRVYELAVSNRRGVLNLHLPPAETKNDGVASLVYDRGGTRTPVAVASLDEVLGPASPAVAKLDVEGAELTTLRGATQILTRIRDLVFEEDAYPSPVTDFLEARGFEIKRLEHTLLRPILADPRTARRGLEEGSNMLATRDLDRAAQRYRMFGWQSLL